MQGFLNVQHRFHVSIDTITNRIHQQGLADIVGGAGGFVRPVGGTGVVKIFFPACRNGLANHVLLAVGAEQKARKGIYRLFLYGDSGVPAQQTADRPKIHLADDRLMGAGNADPLVLWLLHQLLDFIVWPPGLSLNHYANIEGVLQDTPNRYRRPLGLRVALEAGDILHPQGTLVFRGRENPIGVQPVSDPLLAHSFQLPAKNIPHHLGGVIVYNKLILVVRRFQIAVGGKRPHKLSLSLLNL